MSGVNLHDFNILSKKHNYFMTNNRKNGFPALKENSSFLRKILDNKSINSKKKIMNYSETRPKKCTQIISQENIIPLRNNYQSPFINEITPNNSNENLLYNQKYETNFEKFNKDYYVINDNNYISPYKQINVNLNHDLIDSNYYKIPINLRNRVTNSPDFYNQHSNVYSNTNFNDYENDKSVLNYKGKKIFYVNSFSGTKNDTTFNSPPKSTNNKNESELYRNSAELKKKQQEIYQRKMKRESSALKREMLRKEKDKEIKSEKINFDIKSINDYNSNNEMTNKNRANNKNKIKVISLKKNNEINNNNNNNNSNNTIKINSKYKSIDIYLNNNSINANSSTTKKINQKPILNNQNKSNNFKRINKYTINKSKVNKTTNGNSNNPKEKNNDIHPINNTIVKIPPKRNIIFNNIYITKSTDYSPQKNTTNTRVNTKIKENLNDLRKSKKSLLENDSNKQKSFANQNFSTDKYDNPYNYIDSKKRFTEDYTHEYPMIYSNDKKVSIRVHTLRNLNETFIGKMTSKEKMKIHREINIYFDNKAKAPRHVKKNRKYKILSSIKEEKEKTKAEPKPITKSIKPVFQRNIRMKYLCNYNNK